MTQYYCFVHVYCYFEQKGGIPLAPPLGPPLTFQQGRGLK